MELQIGFTKNDNNNINKAFTILQTVQAVLKEDTSLINPSFVISGIDLSNLSEVNYIYVPDFKRYYFVNDIVALKGYVYNIECSVDVLMSHKEDILLVRGTVKRAENNANGYIIDSNYQSLCYSNIVTKKFPNAMNNDTFILLTVG